MAGKLQDGPILVPVDFSPDSEAALRHAAELSGLLKAPLLIVHVVHDPGDAPGYYSVKDQDRHLQKLEDVAAEMFEEFLAGLVADNSDLAGIATAQRVLVTGLPVNRILELADKHGARMIVMGSQGRTGLAHVLLGSKAEQVVRLAKIPVMIVKSGRHLED